MEWLIFGMAFITTVIAFQLGVMAGKRKGIATGFVGGWQQYEKIMLPLKVNTAKMIAITEYIAEQAKNKEIEDGEQE